MKDITVLLLGHRSLAGKDTFFSFAKDYGFVRASFADKLKQTVMDLYGFSHEQMHGSLKDTEDLRYPNTVDTPRMVDREIWGTDDEINLALDNGVEYEDMLIPNPDYRPFFTPRRILQLFGQQQRLLFPDIWASYVFNTTIPELVVQGHNRIAITDFRFQNEAKVAQRWSKSSEFNKLSLIKINRNIVAKSGSKDISEHDLDNFTEWNFTLNNLGSLDEYQALVKDFILKNFK